MARRYGRGKGGRRVVDHAPLNTPQSTTILSSVRLDGEVAFTTFQGGTTRDKFLTYRPSVKSCVSEIRQSQVWSSENRVE